MRLLLTVSKMSLAIYVKESMEADNKYIQFRFEHTQDVATNSDLYRIKRAFAVKRTDEYAFEPLFEGAPVIEAGELEMAIREYRGEGVAVEDFIGGYHGDEILTDVVLKVDGIPVPLGETYILKGKTVEFTQISLLNRCGLPQEVVAEHTKEYFIDKNGIKLHQKVEWPDSVEIERAYWRCSLYQG